MDDENDLINPKQGYNWMEHAVGERGAKQAAG